VYGAYFDRLVREGHAYPCFCSESELEAQRQAQLGSGRPPRYSGRCRGLDPAAAAARLDAGERAALRFRLPPDGELVFEDLVRGPQRVAVASLSDFIIRRSDGAPAFFFCNALDDALMGVTHVLRGEDHLANTPRQLLLLRALGLAAPRYGHLALIVDGDGAPLSKRRGSPTLAALRADGILPAALVNYLARAGHTCESPEVLGLDALASHFSLAGLGRAPTRYDPGQLEHWQHAAVRGLDAAAFIEWGGLPAGQVAAGDQAAFAAVVRPNCARPAQVQEWAAVVYSDDWPMSPDAAVALTDAGPAFFASALAALESAGTDYDLLVRHLRGAEPRRRGPALFQPLRAALTGRLAGPELRGLLALMGAGRARRRLEDAARLARDAC